MSDIFDDYAAYAGAELTGDVKRMCYRHKPVPLKTAADLKRRSARAAAALQGFPALLIKETNFGPYGLLTKAEREVIAGQNKFVGRRGELCFSALNPEKAVICPEEACIMSREYIAVSAKPGLLPQYLLLLFRSGLLAEAINKLTSNSTLQKPGLKNFEKLMIPLPPLSQQQAAIKSWEEKACLQAQRLQAISSLQALFVALNTDILNFLKEAGISVPSYLHSDDAAGEPAVGWIDSALLQGGTWDTERLPAAQELEQAGAAELPDRPVLCGIARFRLSGVADAVTGVNYKAAGHPETGTPVYGSSSVEGGYFSPRALKYLPESFIPSKTKTLVKEKEILLTILGGKESLGNAGLYTGEAALINSSLAKVTPWFNEINPYYLAAYFNTKIFCNQLLFSSKGTKNQFATLDDLQNALVFWLPADLISAYAREYRDIVEQLRQCACEPHDDKHWARICLEKNLF